MRSPNGFLACLHNVPKLVGHGCGNDRWSILVLAKETLSLIELKPGAGNSRGWPHWTMDVGTEILKLEV